MEIIMVICILAIPVVAMSGVIGASLQFAIWIGILVVNAFAQGANQTMIFSFGAEGGSSSMKFITIGQAVGGLIISFMCLMCSLSVSKSHLIFGIEFDKGAFSNSIYFSFSAIVLVINVYAI